MTNRKHILIIGLSLGVLTAAPAQAGFLGMCIEALRQVDSAVHFFTGGVGRLWGSKAYKHFKKRYEAANRSNPIAPEIFLEEMVKRVTDSTGAQDLRRGYVEYMARTGQLYNKQGVPDPGVMRAGPIRGAVEVPGSRPGVRKLIVISSDPEEVISPIRVVKYYLPLLNLKREKLVSSKGNSVANVDQAFELPSVKDSNNESRTIDYEIGYESELLEDNRIYVHTIEFLAD